AVGMVNDFIAITHNQVLFSGDGGLYLLNLQTTAIERLYVAKSGPIGKLAATQTGGVIAIQGNKLLRFSWHDDALKLIDETSLPTIPESRFYANTMLAAGGAVFFVGTNQGLYQVYWPAGANPETVQHKHNPDDAASLISNSVVSLALVPGDILLIGTRKGIDRLSLQVSPIEVIRKVPGQVELCDDVTKGSAVDEEYNLLLVGTQSGLSVVDLTTSAVTCYTPENLPGLRRGYIFNVDPGPTPHSFWIGYRQGGANLLEFTSPETPEIRAVDFSPHDLSTAGVYEVVPDKSGMYWLATSDGLFRHNYATGVTAAFPADPTDSLALTSDNVFCTLTDSKGRQWVGTRNGGLCVQTPREGTPVFECFRYDEEDPGSPPSDMILNLFEDRYGRIWVSNPEALAVYLENGTFRTFGLADDLPYTICYGVFEDASGQLWATFGGHFARFNLSEDGVFELQDIVTRNSGLAGQANAQYGWSTLPDGRLAVSQRTGLNLFHPDSIQDEPSFPDILLTDLELFDQRITANPIEDDPLLSGLAIPDDINRLQTISLPPGRDFISLRFSAAEFRPDHDTYFSYRMKGVQDNWTDIGSRRYLSFPKLPPGAYLLELRTGDARGRWSSNVRTLSIILAAPWYQRWWALFGLGLLVFGLVYWFATVNERQRQRIQTARIMERENFRRRTARDFHDEAGNHLSRVSLLTALAQRAVQPEDGSTATAAHGGVQELLDDIDVNVQSVREGMRDFIWALDPDNDSAYDLALRLRRFGLELFEHHPAEFTSTVISPGLREINLRADQRRHLILFFKEAMHNTFKYAHSATAVTFAVGIDHRTLTLAWQDDGPGFDTQQLEVGNGLKN
ncbi:MAG: triple tyrosine motif-containing protein, partial [Bacteroidota bacterium]